MQRTLHMGRGGGIVWRLMLDNSMNLFRNFHGKQLLLLSVWADIWSRELVLKNAVQISSSCAPSTSAGGGYICRCVPCAEHYCLACHGAKLVFIYRSPCGLADGFKGLLLYVFLKLVKLFICHGKNRELHNWWNQKILLCVYSLFGCINDLILTECMYGPAFWAVYPYLSLSPHFRGSRNRFFYSAACKG